MIMRRVLDCFTHPPVVDHSLDTIELHMIKTTQLRRASNFINQYLMWKSTFLNKSLKQTTGTDTVVERQEVLPVLQKAGFKGKYLSKVFFNANKKSFGIHAV